MNYVTALYSLKGDTFNVKVQEEEYSFSEEVWNNFLDAHGTNPKPNGKRLSGTDQILSLIHI